MFSVEFADGGSQRIEHVFNGGLSLFSLDRDREFSCPNVILYPIVRPNSQGTQVLLGRNFIEFFRIQLDGSFTACIQDTVIYQGVKALGNSREPESYRLADRVNFLRSLSLPDTVPWEVFQDLGLLEHTRMQKKYLDID